MACVSAAPRKPKCPYCDGSDLVEIVYGLPGEELQEAADRGEVQLGGCIVEPNNPDWACRSCGKRWRDEVEGRDRHEIPYDGEEK